MNNYNNFDRGNEAKLNTVTLKNLNEFYIQSSNNGIFNLSNFYMNHGKYFAGNICSYCNQYNGSK